jgi:hypothetical protein
MSDYPAERESRQKLREMFPWRQRGKEGGLGGSIDKTGMFPIWPRQQNFSEWLAEQDKVAKRSFLPLSLTSELSPKRAQH